VITPLAAKVNLVGILESKACHKKTMTFDGAQVHHTLCKTLHCLNDKKVVEGNFEER
jgi:hypothetical protein